MRSFATLLLFATSAGAAPGQTPVSKLTSSELWRSAHVPFSFSYQGVESKQFLSTWQASSQDVPAGTHRYMYSDPDTHLTVIADVRTYPEFPDVVDWVVRFRNEGTADTPILGDILPLDWAIDAPGEECVIHHARGSDARADDFQPLEEHLKPGRENHLESPGGDPSSRNSLPFFNLQTGHGGLIGAIGWTGDWKASFQYSKDGKSLSLASGMKRTHLLLHPGEEIRTARIVLMSWSGDDWQVSQNGWRRLLLAHYTPKDNGKAMRGPVLFGSWGSEPIADKIAYIDWVHSHNIPVELYAVDAGWYGDSFGAEFDPTNPWWKNRGDWFPSPRYYPNGIRPLGEALKAAGFGFSLWIEPETTMPDKKIVRDHPDWYLQSDHPVNPGVELADLGKPAVREGITAMLSRFIKDFEMTWYRQDFNIPPERYWELADTPDRIGMTEIGHVEGLYEMWDQLLAEHPGLHIDNCASGGRRIDIEMMSRSFIVWRTDHGFIDIAAEQGQTQALAMWAPENMGFETFSISKPWTHPGPYTTPESLYLTRLGYNAGYGVGPGAAGVNNDLWVSWIKETLAEYREVQPYFYGDFYPILSYSLAEDTWTAWQWDRPEEKDGLVILLRRPQSPFPTMDLHLKHLDPSAPYEVEIRTTHEKAPLKRMKGSELAHLRIELNNAPSSALIFYRQVNR